MRLALALLLLSGISFALSPQATSNMSVNISLRPGGSYDLNAEGILTIKNPALEYDLLGGILNYTIPDYLSIVETDPSFLQENQSMLSYQSKKITFHFLERNSEKKAYYRIFGSSLNQSGALPVSIREYMQPDPNAEFVWAGDTINYSIEIKNNMGRNISASLLEKEFPGMELLGASANTTLAQAQPEIEYYESGGKTTGKIVWRNFTLAEGESATVRVELLPKKTPQALPKTRVRLQFLPRALESHIAIEKVISENVVSIEKKPVWEGTLEVQIAHYGTLEVQTVYYNPTPFIQEVRELRIMKTIAPDMNLANAMPLWTIINSTTLVKAGEEFRYTARDNVTKPPVYWLYARYSTVTYLRKEAMTTITYEEENTIPELSERPQPPAIAPTPIMAEKGKTGITERPHIELLKRIEKNRIGVGEKFKVYLSIKNPRGAITEGMTVTEYIPEGFEALEAAGERMNNSLVWKIPVLMEGETNITYLLKPQKAGIHTLPPAVVSINKIAGRIFSNYLIVNIVQKEAAPRAEGKAAGNMTEEEPEAVVIKTITKTDYGYLVRIKVVNSGVTKIRSLEVRDPLPKGARIFNIIPFGVPIENRIEWKLGELKTGAWKEIKYALRAGEAKVIAPAIIGVPQDRIAFSLSFSPGVDEGMASRSLEAALILLLALLFIALGKIRLPVKRLYCPTCGRRADGMEYCPGCGKKLR